MIAAFVLMEEVLIDMFVEMLALILAELVEILSMLVLILSMFDEMASELVLMLALFV